jgi:chromosome partitioning protein
MVISIVNHKGGTGKTTSAINLGSALAMEQKSVLLVDLDAQCSLSYSLGIHETEPSLVEAILEGIPVPMLVKRRDDMDILPGSPVLADVELSLAQAEDRYYHLMRVLGGLSAYDYIFIDCPPSLSVLTINALAASEYVIIPMQLDVLSLRGLDSMLSTLEKIRTLNPDIEVLGVLPIMVDPRKNIHKEILEYIRSNYDVRVFNQSIRINVKAAEAPSFGQSVLHYAPSSPSSQDYRSFALEFLEITQFATTKP